MKKTTDKIVLNALSYCVLGFFALFTVMPFILLLMSSFSSERYIIRYGFTLFPREFSLEAYKMVFLNPQRIFRAYGVTIFITAAGTAVSLLLSAMAAYVMYRKEVKYRNHLAFLIYFTTLFSGGLVPFYLIVSNTFKLKNTILVLLLIPMFHAMYILILRNFFRNSIPDSLIESAKIDGANDFRIFVQIVLPLSQASLASIGLFTAMGYWNDWSTAMLFVENNKLYPLQYVLYLILSSTNVAAEVIEAMVVRNTPKESLKLALTVVAIGPIIFVYPFVQKHFVKGITIGSVKG